nr:metal ABC transporter substrate-binding protein [uncultured Sharpea sp.]
MDLVEKREEEEVEGMEEEKDEDHHHDDEEEHDHDHEGEKEEEVEYDEHVWTSLANEQIILKKLSNALIEIDPKHQATLKTNTNAYIKQVAQLEQEIKTIVNQQSEPSAKTLSYLIDYVRKHDVKIVFAIELSNQNVAKTIASETGAKVRTFYTMHNVSAKDYNNHETYVSLTKRNIKVLKEALL